MASTLLWCLEQTVAFKFFFKADGGWGMRTDIVEGKDVPVGYGCNHF